MEKSRRIAFITLCFVAVNLAIGLVFFLRGDRSKNDAELATPALAIDSLTGGPVYFNDPARPFLMKLKPELLQPDDKDPRSERSRVFAAALSDPNLWRQLDRRYRFHEILLIGDPASYRPLLQHLLASADWPLAYVDHTGFIFRRAPAEAWSAGKLESVRKRFEKRSAAERAKFLNGLAAKLAAINRYTAAKGCLDEVLKIDPASPEAWTQLAAYHAHFSQWRDALTKADKALATDPKFIPAMAVKAQVLVAMQRTDDAFSVAEQIADIAPKDPAMLFLVAKVAHAAHAYWREIDVLKRLIDLAETAGQPVSGYCIYLAQAYAAQGEAAPAVAQFEKALTDPGLSKEQRSFVEESIATIKSRVSM